MINSQTEQLLTLSAAARDIPNRQSRRGINVSTVWRWALRGIRGIKLETILVGGIRYTSHEALQRFFEATTAAANGKTDSASASASERKIPESRARKGGM